MSMEIINCEQGSDEWRLARLGIPTASEFSTVLAKGEGKTRKAYMLKLAGEILTGEPMPTYTNPDMERGKIMEEDARNRFAFEYDIEPQRIGFIRNGKMGASPDSLIGTNAGLEIKTALPHIQIERLLRNDLPPEHKAQVQGNLMVAQRDIWHFVSYWPKLPLLVVQVPRDEEYIKNLSNEIDRFNEELAKIIEEIKHYKGTEIAK